MSFDGIVGGKDRRCVGVRDGMTKTSTRTLSFCEEIGVRCDRALNKNVSSIQGHIYCVLFCRALDHFVVHPSTKL